MTGKQKWLVIIIAAMVAILFRTVYQNIETNRWDKTLASLEETNEIILTTEDGNRYDIPTDETKKYVHAFVMKEHVQGGSEIRQLRQALGEKVFSVEFIFDRQRLLVEHFYLIDEEKLSNELSTKISQGKIGTMHLVGKVGKYYFIPNISNEDIHLPFEIEK